MEVERKYRAARRADWSSEHQQALVQWNTGTLAQAVTSYQSLRNGPKDNRALPATDQRQIDHWNRQVGHNESKMTLLVQEPTSGIIKNSAVLYSVRHGDSVCAAVNETSRESHARLVSQLFTGRPQTHELQGVAIRLFEQEVLLHGDNAAQWIFRKCFPSSEADLMIRHSSFAPNRYVPVCVKSTCIRFGVSSNYNFPSRQSHVAYRIAIGVRGYEHGHSDPLHCNDTSLGEARLYECWNLGAYLGPLAPTPAVPYRPSKCKPGLEPDRRTFPFFSTDQQRKAAVNRLLRDLMDWPHRLSREEILYENSILNRTSFSEARKTHMRCFAAVDKVVQEAGLGTLEAPARESETVDSIINVSKVMIAISHQTAGILKNKPGKRRICLKTHKNHQLCDLVVASCPDSGFKRVFVFSARDLYKEVPKGYFFWHLNKIYPHIQEFDLSSEEGRAGFVQRLRACAKMKAEAAIADTVAAAASDAGVAGRY